MTGQGVSPAFFPVPCKALPDFFQFASGRQFLFARPFFRQEPGGVQEYIGQQEPRAALQPVYDRVSVPTGIFFEHISAEGMDKAQLFFAVRRVYGAQGNCPGVVACAHVIGQCLEKGLRVFAQVFVEQNQRLVGEVFFQDLNLVEKANIAVLPEAFVPICVEELGEGLMPPVFYVSAVLGSDPPVVPAQQQNGACLRESF